MSVCLSVKLTDCLSVWLAGWVCICDYICSILMDQIIRFMYYILTSIHVHATRMTC